MLYWNGGFLPDRLPPLYTGARRLCLNVNQLILGYCELLLPIREFPQPVDLGRNSGCSSSGLPLMILYMSILNDWAIHTDETKKHKWHNPQPSAQKASLFQALKIKR